MIRFSDNGYVVHVPDDDVENYHDEWLAQTENFGGRIPLIFHPKTRDIYLGRPNWSHMDTEQYHSLPWEFGHHGYFGGGRAWGNGALKWYMGTPDEHEDVEKALVRSGVMKPTPVEPQPQRRQNIWE